jgi:ABC-type branched-subunit amino acid transport system ATPase component
MALLGIENVFSGYGVSTILHGVSLQVAEKSLTAVFGPNGGGKTTLVNTLFRLIPAQKGRITFDGSPVLAQSTEDLARRGMALVPQEGNVFRNLSVSENLAIGSVALGSGSAGASIDQAYALFPALEDRSKQLAGTLSGGERQMLAIASAMVARPRLLVLDEPTSGLAPIVVQALIEATVNYARSGATVLWMVGDCAEEILPRADHAYLLQAGTIAGSWQASALPISIIAELYFGTASHARAEVMP